MILALGRRLLGEPEARIVRRFLVNAVWKGSRVIRRFHREKAAGDFVPPFLFVSITNECNLACQGCWVTPTDPPRRLPPEILDRVITESQARGASFFGLLGGEPLLYPGLFEILARHPEACFQVFTNGLRLTDEVAARLRALGNVTPLVSIEGKGEAGDERRGGHGIYAQALDALDRCRRHRLLTGVATSVCRTNMADLASEEFLREMVRRGVHYAWYYIYRPVGPRPSPELALSAEEIRRLREFLVDVRRRVPILVVDAYWDADGRALCPAALGLSHHVNPSGDIEPCPVIQFAVDGLGGKGRVDDVIRQSAFLAATRSLLGEVGGGCILMRRPDRLRAFLEREGARDTTGRGTGLAELAAMSARPDHDMGAQAIPERHWLYRMAKRRFFFGLGAYG